MKSVVLALIAVVASPALGQTITGNDVVHACGYTDSGVQEGFCVGYVVGLWEGIHWGTFVALTAAGPEQGASVEEANAFASVLLGSCVPPHVENSQIRDVMVGYLRDHPETRHESARGLMQQAMAEAFPCPPE